MSEAETMILVEQGQVETSASFDERLSSLLQLKRQFEHTLRGTTAVEDDKFALATFNLMQGCCKFTGASGASLYRSKREGYLDRQGFCFDSSMDYEQVRSASQASEHVAVGQGIAGFMALDVAARERLNYTLKYPVKENDGVSVWDIRAVAELPAQLRSRTARLNAEAIISISSMFLVKHTGEDGTDYILQLVRKSEDGSFSDQEKLLAETFAELIIPDFRSVEDNKQRASSIASGPDIFTQFESQSSAHSQQTGAEAYESIRAIAIAAIDAIRKISETRR